MSYLCKLLDRKKARQKIFGNSFPKNGILDFNLRLLSDKVPNQNRIYNKVHNNNKVHNQKMIFTKIVLANIIIDFHPEKRQESRNGKSAQMWRIWKK